jgi:hypothetical protein
MFNNLLNQALTLIPKQTFTYCKFAGTTINDEGIKQDTYEPGIEFQGSVQAIEQAMYEKLGLQWSKKYIQIYSSLDIRNTDNQQVSPDKVIWHGKEYIVTKVTNWYLQDGWTNIIAVENTEEQEQNANS